MSDKEIVERIAKVIREHLEKHMDMTELLKYVELKGIDNMNEKVEIEKESNLTAYDYIEEIKPQYNHGHSLETWFSLCHAQDCIIKLDKIEQTIDEYQHDLIDSNDVFCEILKILK